MFIVFSSTGCPLSGHHTLEQAQAAPVIGFVLGLDEAFKFVQTQHPDNEEELFATVWETEEFPQ